MGLLNLIPPDNKLGQILMGIQQPLNDLGVGLTRGKTWQKGLREASKYTEDQAPLRAELAQQQMKLDTEANTRNKTAEWLRSQPGGAQFADALENGMIDGSTAFKTWYDTTRPQQTDYPAEYDLFQLTQKDPEFAEYLKNNQGQGGSGQPATVQEWEYFNALPEEMKGQYLRMKRASPYLDVGTGYVQPDPLKPGTPAGPAIAKDNFTPAFDTATGKGVGEANAASIVAAPKDISAGEAALNIIDQIKTHPALATATGSTAPLNQYLVGTTRFDFENLVNQAKSGAFLTAVEQMRGLGALSNAEGQAATAAITRMNTASTKDGFLKAVADYERIVRQGITRAQSKLPGGAPATANNDPLGLR